MAGIRRTWDKSLYEQRARDRLEKGDDFIESSTGNRANRANQALREEFKAAESNASGPIGSERAFLKSREARLNLEDKAGKIEIINPADVEGQKAGFWCEVCKVLLKDSASYLNHINGKKRM
jgi:U4/U6.U5 tri-snRNP component SNU23